MNTEEYTMLHFIVDNNICLSYEIVDKNPEPRLSIFKEDVITFKCTLSKDGDTFVYYRTIAPTWHPTTDWILNELKGMNSGILEARDFDHWCSLVGIKTNYPNGEASYIFCVNRCKELKKFLGPSYGRFLILPSWNHFARCTSNFQ